MRINKRDQERKKRIRRGDRRKVTRVRRFTGVSRIAQSTSTGEQGRLKEGQRDLWREFGTIARIPGKEKPIQASRKFILSTILYDILAKFISGRSQSAAAASTAVMRAKRLQGWVRRCIYAGCRALCSGVASNIRCARYSGQC